MKVLVTGSQGFIASHLIHALYQLGHEVFKSDRNTDDRDLRKYICDSDFVFHLAGCNRPKDAIKFYQDNTCYTTKLATLYNWYADNNPKLIYASSIQAGNGTEYGDSKLESERILQKMIPQESLIIMRIENIFGSGSKPFYNSVVATFCHQISRGLPIEIIEDRTIALVFIDDIVDVFVNIIEGKTSDLYPITFVRVGKLAEIITQFSLSNGVFQGPTSDFIKQLYQTYQSYVPIETSVIK